MKDFGEYTFANITDECNDKITHLEDEIKSQCGEEVVLIAYHTKDDSNKTQA